MRILIVEEDRAVLNTLFIYLKDFCKLEVHPTNSVEVAIALLKRFSYDLIFTDFFLAAGTCLPLMEEARNRYKYESTKIVLLTALQNPEILVKEYGFTGALKKPFEPEELDNWISAKV